MISIKSDPAEQLGTEELLALVDGLHAGWGARVVSAELRATDVNQSFLIIGLAKHTHRLLPVAADLIRRGLILESLPIIRQAYELGLTSQWLKHVPDSFLSLMGEADRQRRNKAKTLRKAGRDFEVALADAIENSLPDDPSIFATVSLASGRNFYQLCNDLEPGGAQAYAIYSELSGYSHASAFLVDLYFETNPDDPEGNPLFTADFQLTNGRPWAYLLACAAVWAGRSLDMADRNHPRRSELRQAARALGITSELKLSEEAWLRLHRKG